MYAKWTRTIRTFFTAAELNLKTLFSLEFLEEYFQPSSYMAIIKFNGFNFRFQFFPEITLAINSIGSARKSSFLHNLYVLHLISNKSRAIKSSQLASRSITCNSLFHKNSISARIKTGTSFSIYSAAIYSRIKRRFSGHKQLRRVRVFLGQVDDNSSLPVGSDINNSNWSCTSNYELELAALQMQNGFAWIMNMSNVNDLNLTSGRMVVNWGDCRWWF